MTVKELANKTLDRLESLEGRYYDYHNFDFAADIKLREFVDKSDVIPLLPQEWQAKAQDTLSEEDISQMFWDVIELESRYLFEDYLTGCQLGYPEQDNKELRLMRLALEAAATNFQHQGRSGGWCVFDFNRDRYSIEIETLEQYCGDNPDYMGTYVTATEARAAAKEINAAIDACEWLVTDIEHMARGLTTACMAKVVAENIESSYIDNWSKEACCVSCHQVVTV